MYKLPGTKNTGQSRLINLKCKIQQSHTKNKRFTGLEGNNCKFIIPDTLAPQILFTDID